MRRTALALAVLAACSRVDKPDLEPLYRAGKTISVATDVGVNQLRFGELLHSFATEVAIAEDKASGANRAVVERYRAALAIYQDASRYWNLGDGYSERPVKEQILKRHGIEGPTGIEADEILAIWKKADAEIASAEALYLGRS